MRIKIFAKWNIQLAEIPANWEIQKQKRIQNKIRSCSCYHHSPDDDLGVVHGGLSGEVRNFHGVRREEWLQP